MGILGLTHDENGTALKKLPVTIKVAIGEGPELGNGNSYPRKLDHFIFKRKTLRGQDVVWEPAAGIAQAHGDKATSLGIIFLNDDPREVFRTEYALWTPSGCKCHGELVQIANPEGVRFEMRAIRRTQKHPEGESWPGNYKYVDGPKKGQPVEPCGDGCPDLERGDCKPSGDLYFILEKFPTFGAICRLHTSSYRSIRNLSNGLMQIRRLNGGRLTGIKATLKASPERISYTDHDGTRHTSVAYILSLEIGGTDLRSLVTNMTEPLRLLSEGHALVNPSPRTQFVAHETDGERAGEIAREFYSHVDADTNDSTNSVAEQQDNELLTRICELGRQLGYNDARIKMLVGQFAPDLGGLERKLEHEFDERPQSIPAGRGVNDRGHQSSATNAQGNNEVSLSNTPAKPSSKQHAEPTVGFLY